MIDASEVERILMNDAGLDDSQRADLWDAVVSGSHADLGRMLGSLPVSPATRGVLKLHKALDALQSMEPATLRNAETHPTVLNMLLAAQSRGGR
jgi:hypothetical protein